MGQNTPTLPQSIHRQAVKGAAGRHSPRFAGSAGGTRLAVPSSEGSLARGGATGFSGERVGATSEPRVRDMSA